MKLSLLFLILALLAYPYGLAQTDGPLRTQAGCPYFVGQSGQAVYLTGSHTWANFQDITSAQDTAFDWPEYLDMLTTCGHNFIRLWVWEQQAMAAWTQDSIAFSPLPYVAVPRSSHPQYDLTRWNDAYFNRLLHRVRDARSRGIYVAVMLFQGWSQNKTRTPGIDIWAQHPFHPSNNLQAAGKQVVDSEVDSEARHSLHSTQNGDLLAHQKAYVTQVVTLLTAEDNVLWEIINEGGTLAWQEAMIDHIRHIEHSLGTAHPIGMTHAVSVEPMMYNADLFASSADWISPAKEPQAWSVPGSVFLTHYEENPPPNTSDKVIILDSDHLWGHGGSTYWVWKSFCQGLNPIFMDPWRSLAGTLDRERMTWLFIEGGISKDDRNFPDYDPIRRNMGYTRRYAEKMDLRQARPWPSLSSTAYCLAQPGSEYLIYFPTGGTATIDLRAARGPLTVEWFIPQLNRTLTGQDPLPGGQFVVLTAPFSSGDAVLYLKAIEE